LGKKKRTDKPRIITLIAKAAGILFLSGAGLFILLIILVSAGIFGPVPNRSDLENIRQMQASRVISADGVHMGTFHLQNRTTVRLEEISPEMIDALIAIEDIRFHNHNGIDNRALARVLVRTILLGQNAGGGSTITQQLAKNLYPRENSRGFFIVTDKLREMIIARRIERIYSKDQILELYLNTVSFGEDTFGIEMASYRFFNKPPSDLTLPEAATLAGVLQATTFYNPHRNPERSELRRNVVIRQMERYGMIASALADSAASEPLITDYNRTAITEGIAPYFREHLRGELRRILESEPALDENTYHLNTDGLTIHTTIDTRIQHAAEKAVAKRMKELQAIFDREQRSRPVFGEEDPDVLHAWRQSWHHRQLREQGHTEEEIKEILHTPVPTQLFTWDGYVERKLSPYDEIRYYISFLNAGFLAMHPRTGDVLAWVGGIDHRHFQFDQVKARRQPGSAFKPVLYAAALETGREPCDYQRNLLATYTDYDGWTPRNHSEEYGGRYSLQAALAQSVNTVAVHLAMETGVPAVQNTASAMGIHSRMPEAPSIALGTAEVSLLELTAAYTSFLNEGRPAAPRYITKIYNAAGELIYDFSDYSPVQPERQLVEYLPGNLLQAALHPKDETGQPGSGISDRTAASMVRMLEKAINEGTGAPLRSHYGIQTALGGKTGTTQQFTDGWFIGFTPELVFGTRVGGWNNRVRFREFPAYASQTALPISGHFLQEVSRDQNLREVYMPVSFHPSQTDTPHNLQCADYRDDRLRDRVRDFFTGRSSDEPREIGGEKEEEKRENVFRRLGRRLGL
jgi:penicillin-binding protein 1A